MLGLNAEDSPPTVSATLLESLTARTGTEVNIACLQDMTQRMVSLKIDLKNLQLLSNHITACMLSKTADHS